MADAASAKVIAIATAQLSAEDRARIEHDSRETAAGKVALHTRHDAIKWGDGWMERAHRLQAQLTRTQMLLWCAEVHEKASELLLAHAEQEIERLRALIK